MSPYEEGVKAYHNGISQNPYVEFSDKWAQ
jgi:hypothetical protein